MLEGLTVAGIAVLVFLLGVIVSKLWWRDVWIVKHCSYGSSGVPFEVVMFVASSRQRARSYIDQGVCSSRPDCWWTVSCERLDDSTHVAASEEFFDHDGKRLVVPPFPSPSKGPVYESRRS